MDGNPGDTGSIVGRAAELALIDEVLASGQPQLVLLVGAPGIGKGHLLRAVRARAARAGRVVLPAQPKDASAPWLVIDKKTTIEEFIEATTIPEPESGFETDRARRPPGASGEYPVLTSVGRTRRRPGGLPVVVLVYGYWPDEMFGQWFTAKFASQRAESVPRRTIIITATSADAEPLLRHPGLVDRVVNIVPLPAETMLSELHAINDQISDTLTERELDLYAEALASEPSLLDAFRRLLPLTGKADDEAP
jgi:AAA ATPase domain